ncbi:efflux RND transporter permease subunit, partial [Planctomycetota bacterium]
IIKHLELADPGENTMHVVFRAAREVGSAVLTAVSTTVVSFLPVFTMTAAEGGKLFKPLAFTKTFALIASIIIALLVLPALAHMLFTIKLWKRMKQALLILLALIGFVTMFVYAWWAGFIIVSLAVFRLVEEKLPQKITKHTPLIIIGLIVLAVGIGLAKYWAPLGPEKGSVRNFIFVALIVGGLLGFFFFFHRAYGTILAWALKHKLIFLSIPFTLTIAGFVVWLGFTSPVIPLALLFILYAGLFYGGFRLYKKIRSSILPNTVTLFLVIMVVLAGVVGFAGVDTFDEWVPRSAYKFGPVSWLVHTFPGMGKEFMPPLDEGSYLYMPTTMPHASIGEAMDVLRKQDMAITAIPEVDSAVGKIGRADTPLDPAPVSMVETVINYKSEYILDKNGRRKTFRYDPDRTEEFKDKHGNKVNAPDGKPYIVQGKFERDEKGDLIPDSNGIPFRQWRPRLDPELNQAREVWAGIRGPEDIWNEILDAGEIPGSTSAPMLQPISTRLVMLQSGMRAPMGIKVKGDKLEDIEKVGIRIEELLKSDEAPPSIDKAKVIADRIVGKPYLEIHIDRNAIARYGIKLQTVQKLIETAVGGMAVTSTVEGRERYPVRVRYKRELRDSIESLGQILVPAPNGVQIPLEQVSEIRYVRGPQVIKSEDTFRVGYVLFDKKPGYAEVDAVEQTQVFLKKQEEIFSKAFNGKTKELGRELTKQDIDELPGLNTKHIAEYVFAGTYENQLKAKARFAKIIPLALFVIFMILYLQFRSVVTSLLVFTSIIVAWAGGFLMLGLYSSDWFLNFSMFGAHMRELFQVHPYNMSIAIWVGFLALFGIASDDAVVITTYLNQIFDKDKPGTREAIHKGVIQAGKKRVRPCLMTTATTILALIPILTSTGRGSDIMIPMALPSFGGMMMTVVYIFLVPVLYSMVKEQKLNDDSSSDNISDILSGDKEG